jgi:hypothetical protein
MNKNIRTSNGKIGWPEEVFTLKPAKASDFEYAYNKEEFKEPQNIIEEVKQLFKNIVVNVKNIKKNLEEVWFYDERNEVKEKNESIRF